MGQAFDDRGNVLGEAFGETKREVFDKLDQAHNDAAEIRIRTLLAGRRRSLSVEQIAQVCHDANRAYALATGEDPTSVWPTWDVAPNEILTSAVTGVKHALEGATPEQLHQSWCISKFNDGWGYGAVRDNAGKLHPCMVPYAELPAAQRAKDALFHAIVEALR